MYIHIASTYSIITLFAGDIWSNEIIIVQDLDVIFVCVILTVMLCLLSKSFASHVCHFCNILTLITERGGESVRRWSDDETWRLLIHISSTVAFQAALWWNPSRFVWPQGTMWMNGPQTWVRTEQREVGVGGGGVCVWGGGRVDCLHL